MSVPDVYRNTDDVALAYPKSSSSSHDRLDLRAIMAIFQRRARLFFYTAIIIFDIAALLALWLPAKYTATAEVVLNTHDDSVTPTTQTSEPDLPTSTPGVETQIAILTSRDLAVKVVDYFGLENDPDMRALIQGGGPIMWLKRAFGLAPPPPAQLTGEARARLREVLIGRVSGNLDVERLTSAYALSVSYTDTNPLRAAVIANAFAHLYTDGQIKQKQVQNREAVQLLGARINALRRQAQTDFEAVQLYRVRNNLLSTTGASLTEQEISAYNQQVAAARAEAAADAARLNTARAQLHNGSNGDDVGEALSSPVVQGLRTQRAVLSAKVADYAGNFGPKNPDLLDALRQLADVDGQIQAEINRTISNLDAKARVSRERVNSLIGSLGTAQGSLAQNNRAMVSLDDLQRRADTSQALYQSYLNRYKEVVAEGGAERADSRLVSDARIPNVPSFPKPMLFMPLGLLLGVGAGIAVALIAEVTFSGLTTGEEVEERLGVPYFGGVPELKTVEPRTENPIETIKTMPRSPFAEAFRGLLGGLRQTGDRNQVILVTSALPDEGKTTIAACLAQSAALGAERAIVIDCDSTRRQYSERFAAAAKGQPGLREVLAGTTPFAEAIVYDAGSGVHMLPITTPFGTDELLIDRGKMHALVAQLREQFDLIVLDTAPILPVAETRELTVLADKIIIVGHWRRTPDKAISSAIRLLPPIVRRSVGVVLTRINMKQQTRFGYGDPGSFYRQYRSYYSG